MTFKTLILAVITSLLIGCSVSPQRPFTVGTSASCANATRDPGRSISETPEVANGYTLHFVEFDDQGWLFSNDGRASDTGTPESQIDCAIGSIAETLKNPTDKVSLFVYVHGWHHSAHDDDKDVAKFRRILKKLAADSGSRKIIGIYVGWQGETLDVPIIRDLTFWGRKNAAEHVASGRVRELFSRIRGLRAYWNGRNSASPDTICKYREATGEEPASDPCPIRTVLIGHSFGGLILFESAEPYLIETLTVYRDVPKGSDTPKESPISARARGLADLIVLLNPAFEATRYEPLYRANLQHLDHSPTEPPILVSLTSISDDATKVAFPIIRTLNSLFQYPASTDDQSREMKRTPGHVDRLLTHRLCYKDDSCDRVDGQTQVRYCKDLTLIRFDGNTKNKDPIVWNVRTDEKVIADHNDILNDRVENFVEQVYSKIVGMPEVPCAATPTAKAADSGKLAAR